LVALSIFAVSLIRANITHERMSQVRAVAEAAEAIVAGYHARAQAGEITVDQAQIMARDAIRFARYSDGAEYVFVFDYDGVAQVMGPRPEWEGTNKLNLLDANGKPFLVDLIAAARAGGGTVDYQFPRSGSSEAEPKLSWAVGFEPWRWMIGTGVYVSDVDAAVWSAAVRLFGGAALVLAVAIILAMVVIRGITKPIADLTSTMTTLAGGDLEVAIPGTDRKDEIGEMADSVKVFQVNAREVERLQSEQAREQRRNARRVKNEMLAMTNALDEEVRNVMAQVLEQSDAMHGAAAEMAHSVADTEQGAEAAAMASRTAAASVDAVAAAAEQLSHSIAEISGQVAGAANVAGQAALQAETTNTHVAGLAEAASQIGQVVNLISDVAKQTNLLALNATIEAARAGEAGKGFAVVANEVKTLANQTASATEEIARRIESIQSATQDAVDAISGIGAVIGQLNETSAAIAAAVEEQTAATGEISHNAQRASEGTQESTASIGAVSSSSKTTGEYARSVQSSSEQVRARIRHMQASLESIMRSGQDADPEASRLRPVNVSATLRLAASGRTTSCTLRSLTYTGVGTLNHDTEGQPGEEIELIVSDLGPMSGSVVARTDVATHIRLDVDEAIAEKVQTFVKHRDKAVRA